MLIRFLGGPFRSVSFGLSKHFSEIKEPFGKYYKPSQLTEAVFQKMAAKNEEFLKLSSLLSSEKAMNTATDKDRRRFDRLSAYNYYFEKLNNVLTAFEDLHQMKEETPKEDKESLKILEDEIKNHEKMLEELMDTCLDMVIPRGMYDNDTVANIEVRPGAGGTESSLFADDVVKMYQNFFSDRGWDVDVISYQADNNLGSGCKHCHMRVKGEEVYRTMRCESGVHKVIRIPETEKAGRLHSSTISVAVLPEKILEVKVDDKDLKIEFMRSSGPGGQAVNKTESACRVTHVPTGISAFIQDGRDQTANKNKAIQVVKEKVMMQESLKHQQEIDFQRSSQVGSGDRSEKIRTYNFPQSRITDHRTGLTLYGIEKMMNGELLDQFIDKYLATEREEILKEFLEGLKKE